METGVVQLSVFGVWDRPHVGWRDLRGDVEVDFYGQGKNGDGSFEHGIFRDGLRGAYRLNEDVIRIFRSFLNRFVLNRL